MLNAGDGPGRSFYSRLHPPSSAHPIELTYHSPTSEEDRASAYFRRALLSVRRSREAYWLIKARYQTEQGCFIDSLPPPSTALAAIRSLSNANLLEATRQLHNKAPSSSQVDETRRSSSPVGRGSESKLSDEGRKGDQDETNASSPHSPTPPATNSIASSSRVQHLAREPTADDPLSQSSSLITTTILPPLRPSYSSASSSTVSTSTTSSSSSSSPPPSPRSSPSSSPVLASNMAIPPQSYESLYHQASDTISLVTKDVLRTHASRLHFRRTATQLLLQRILILWALEHSWLGYKQGMNEIVAHILLALRADQVGHPIYYYFNYFYYYLLVTLPLNRILPYYC